MAEKREFKGVWIPKMVYLNRDVSWSAKIIWLEIDSFTSEGRDCFFSNEYLAEFLGCSITQVTRYLVELKEAGWIEQSGFDGRKRYLVSLIDSSKMVRQDNHSGLGTHTKNGEHKIPNYLTNIPSPESNDSVPKEPLLFDSIPETEVLKESKKNKKGEPDEFYPAFVQEWTQAYPELGFDGISGKKIKSLITKTNAYLTNSGKEVTLHNSVNMFLYILAYVKRVSHFCHGKPMTTFESQYLSIIFEIKNGKSTGQKKQSARDYINSFK